jgi:hypothetical protein
MRGCENWRCVFGFIALRELGDVRGESVERLIERNLAACGVLVEECLPMRSKRRACRQKQVEHAGSSDA